MTAAKPHLRSLPLDQWPPSDREAWLSACRPGHRLTAPGRAGHLKEVTREDLQRRYAGFLHHCWKRGVLDLDAPAGVHVNGANVNSYVATMRERGLSSVTIYKTLLK